jgi:hypothetical protein
MIFFFVLPNRSNSQRNIGKNAINKFLVTAPHKVYLKKLGDNEKIKATINANRSSSLISLANIKKENVLKIPKIIPNINITYSIVIDEDCDTPDKKNWDALGYE